MTYNVRLCTVTKRSDFEGYGFNLHSEANKPGQFIGHVEMESPAYHAGLIKNDILIEVNGFNVCDENHQQVVQRIKANPDKVTLLIIDNEGFNYCKAHHIEINKELIKTDSHDEHRENIDKTVNFEDHKKVNDVKVVPEVNVNNQSDHNVSSSKKEDVKPVNNSTDKSNIEDLSIEEIRAKAAMSGLKKRQRDKAPSSFKDRAHLFDQL